MLSSRDQRLGRAGRALAQFFADKSAGQIAFTLWNGERVAAASNAPPLDVTIRSPAAMRRLIMEPGMASMVQLYASGDIDIGDRPPLAFLGGLDHVRFLSEIPWMQRAKLLRAALPLIIGGGAAADSLAYTGNQSRSAAQGRNDQSLIHFHYDISNRFYELFLDSNMAYSCAYFEEDGYTLEQAQTAKLDLICRKLRLKPGQKLFDPGCGWGSLVCYAAKNYGVTAHGVTLAKEQLEYCQAKIARMGLQDLVTVELRDYRSVTTPEAYDAIGQIEMFEHLGLDNHDAHFAHMRHLLKSRGLYLHQASTRRASPVLGEFRKQTGYMRFINQYIFPGGELDYIGLTVTNLERMGFEVHDVENMREHFQKTSEAWASRLWDNRAEAAKEVGEARTRMWLAFISATVVGFRRLNINLFQTLASKRHTGASGLPFNRRWITERPQPK